MVTEIDIKETLKTILTDVETNTIKNDDNLFGLGLDSLNIINLIIAIENKYNIKFEDEDLKLKNWESISKIKEIIERNINYRGNII